MAKKGQLTSLFFSLLLFVGLLTAWLNRYAIYDWWRLRGYQPSSQVAQLAVTDTMTTYARHMFYVNRPSVESKADFNQSCPNNGGEQTIVLGCYHASETGIFLYSVTDPKLNGVEQVTAAHETLHAIYERLSSKQRNYVDGLLEDYYQHDLKDKRLLATIASYKKTEPNDVVNEMHSVFGTEAANLPPALETYYRQYFTNRKQIATYAQKYQQTFTNNQSLASKYLAQIKTFEQQLTGLKSQIDAEESRLRTEDQKIESERHTTTDVNAFNAEVISYNAEVRTYRGLIQQYNNLIDEHNSLVSKYQAITVETNQLIQELDSRSASVSSQ